MEAAPVRAFWSVTAYDKEGYFIANTMNRYAIGDRDKLKFNPDGSLDLYIQDQNPGADLEANWLPSGDGIFNLTMRLYWPEPSILDGSWQPPTVEKIPVDGFCTKSDSAGALPGIASGCTKLPIGSFGFFQWE